MINRTPPMQAARLLLIAVSIAAAIVSIENSGSCAAHAEELSEKSNDLAQFYGFSGVELFKLDERAFNLAAGDFDSDGLTDILLVDNRSSSIRLLRQQTDAEQASRKSGSDVNDLVSDWRFDIRQISVDKPIAGMATADFNSDGREDVAYIGVPDQLVVKYQPEPGKEEWTERWSIRLPELTPTSWMISAGDLNGDKRADIVVLGESVTYVVYQDDEGKMKAPEHLINTSPQLSMIQVADIDGDGRSDMCYMANEGSERGLCARLQTADGRLGPEVCFDLQQPRSVTLHDVDQLPGKEVLTIDARTGRVLVSKLKRSTTDNNELPARLVQYGIGKATSSRGRAVAVGDINGDGLTDAVVTDPENAQVLVYRQNGIDGLDTAEIFPGLLGATDVAIMDADGDGSNEVILMSEKEAAIAVSRFENGRLTFPQAVARPEAGFELAAIEALGNRLAVVTKKGSGNRAEVRLQQFQVNSDSVWEPVGLREPQSLPSGTLGSRGIDLLSMDVNGDQQDDLLLIPNGSNGDGLRVLFSGDEHTLTEAEGVRPLDLGTSSGGSLFVDGSSLLVSRDSFARAMTFGDEGWKVADQFNAGESKARIEGVAALNLDNEDGNEIVLVDSGIRKLRVLKSTSGLYRPWKEVELGSLRLISVHVADLNGDHKDDLLLFGNEQFSVLYSGRVDSTLEEIASWESDRDDAYPADIIAGDLNGDNAIDLTTIDTSFDGVEILRFDESRGLEPATHFRVFEEKRLVSESDSRGTEPREGLVADVTGDGRGDLILLCHDRLVLYPQDDGATP
ncbi:MAG: VCBS repeat-containing protein [Planctomycetaceae bacterium]